MVQHSRIFISYSHKDTGRADFLLRELCARGHEVLIDREGILEAEHITNRIREMIAGADIVLLVLGPNWIASPACRMELGFALDRNKRILPAAFEDVGADLPAEIKDINYVRFYGPGGACEEAIERLDTATDRDIDWIRLHTRFGEQAALFIAGEAPPPRGRALRAMRAWIERHPDGAPDPTAQHWRYFKAGMARRKWLQIGGAVTLTLALTLATVGGVREIATAQCEALRDGARASEGLNPVAAIETILTLADNSFCRTSDAWLALLGTLGEAMRDQRLRATLSLPDPQVQTVAFLPGTGHVLALTADGGGAVLDMFSGAQVEGEMPMPGSGVARRIQFDAGRFLLMQDRRVTVWDAAVVRGTGMAFGTGGPATHAVLSPGGDTLVVATGDNRLHFHSLASGRALREPMVLGAPARFLSFVPDRPRVVAAAGDMLRVIDIVPAPQGRRLAVPRTLPMPGDIMAMSLSGDGSTVAAASGNVVGVWDLTTFEPIFAPAEYFFGPVDIQSLGLSPDGLQLAVGARDRAFDLQYARIHDVPSGKYIITLQGHDQPVQGIRFSPDGQSVITRDAAGVLRLYDVATGRPAPDAAPELAEAVIATSQAVVRFDAAAGRARLTATGTEISLHRNQPRILRLAHVDDAAPPFYNDRLAHDGLVTSMALSPDERLLVTGADDGRLYLWDTQTGLLLYTLGHAVQGLVTFVAADFAPTGDHIVSWDNHGRRRVWAVQPLSGDLLQTACRLLPLHDGVRSFASGAIGAATHGGDPCDSIRPMPRRGGALWLAGGD